MLWMVPTHEGLQAVFAAALSKPHTSKRAAISWGMASHGSRTQSMPVTLDTKVWPCRGEGSEVIHYKHCL